MEIIPLTSGDTRLEALYEEVLAPSFPPNELVEPGGIAAMIAQGRGRVRVAVDDAGRILGAAVGEWDAPSRVVLLSWLAVRPGLRAGGVGAPLLRAAIDAWRAEFSPCLVLAEVEDPAWHSGSGAYGDPVARLRFYLRFGARALDLPYFQPELRAGTGRVPHLLLMVLHADAPFAGTGPDTLDGAPVRRYLETYHVQSEGAVGRDAQSAALWQALERPGGVPYLALTRA